MDIDNLFKMTSDELDLYLAAEVERIVNSAPPEKRDRLRAIHNGARMQVIAAKNPADAMIRIYDLMWAKFSELNKSLKDVKNIN